MTADGGGTSPAAHAAAPTDCFWRRRLTRPDSPELDVASAGAADDDACSESAARALSRKAAHADRSDSAEAAARSPEDRTTTATAADPGRQRRPLGAQRHDRRRRVRRADRTGYLDPFTIRFRAAAVDRAAFKCAPRLPTGPRGFGTRFNCAFERPLIWTGFQRSQQDLYTAHKSIEAYLALVLRNVAERSPELIFLLQKGSIDRVERDKREISSIFAPIRDFGGPRVTQNSGFTKQ